MSVEAFLTFISFEPLWREQAKTYLEQAFDNSVSVELHAFDKRHLVYAIHQAQFHETAALGFFEIILRRGGKIFGGMRGEYTWDGATCPTSAEGTIDEIYGSILFARLSFGSAVDNARYEHAYPIHGFVPAVDLLDENGSVHRSAPHHRYSIRDFVIANPEYSAAISVALESIGPLPTAPST